ncbi:MAG: peroxide stress protein YaaA [Chloroflexi bacterium]|nr:peroxide stress protein YaaA [Chloroflexota bacterium]
MDLILIACCKTKSGGGTTTYQASELEKCLPCQTYRRLLEARSELGRHLGLPPGPDLGGSTSGEPIQYLPAYLRYSGHMYKSGRVKELYPRAQDKKLMIISALYGVVDAAHPIRSYEAHMNGLLPHGTRLKTWWKHHHLGRIVEECILALEPARVHDLLSTPYRPALAPWPPRGFTGAGITYVPYDYPGTGIESNYRRGDDLRRLLGGVCEDNPGKAEMPRPSHLVDYAEPSVQDKDWEEKSTPMTQRDQIRSYVVEEFIEPARGRGEKTVVVRASEIAHKMGLTGRYPNICGALDADVFAPYARVRLLKRKGPAQSSSVTWTFQL